MRHFPPNTLSAASRSCLLVGGYLSFFKKMKPEILFGPKRPALVGNRWLALCWRIHAGGQEAYPCAKQVPSESSPLSPAHRPMRTRVGDVTTSRFPALPGGWDQLGKRANVSDGCHNHVGKEVEGK